MKLPWVSRSALVIAEALASRLQRELVRTQIELDRARTEALTAGKTRDMAIGMIAEQQTANVAERRAFLQALERSHQGALSLKRSGYEPAPAEGQYRGTVMEIHQDIEAAIRKMASPRTPLYAQLREFAENQVAAGVSVDLIVKKIKQGADLDALEDEDDFGKGDTLGEDLVP